MAKKFLVKLVALLTITILGYSIFWFFKAGQLEKHINNFVANSASNVSVASFDISGYPLKHKITVRDLRFSLPSESFGKNKIVVKKVEAVSEVFQNEFMIDTSGDVIVFDARDQINNVEFLQRPKARLLFADGNISEFSYDDSGYRVFNSSRNLIYSSSSSSVKFSAKPGDNGKILAKVKIKVRDMEGFDAANIYRNSFEKDIVDAIKTGEITIGSSENTALTDENADLVAQNDGAEPLTPEGVEKLSATNAENAKALAQEGVALVPEPQKVKADKGTMNSAIATNTDPALAKKKPTAEAAPTAPVAKVAIKTDGSKPMDIAKVAKADPKAVGDIKVERKPNAELPIEEKVAGAGLITSERDPVTDAKIKTGELTDVAVKASEAVTADPEINSLLEIDSVKSDLDVDLDYVLMPENNGQNLAIPTDPTQIQTLRTKYNKSFKITRIQISNSLYKVMINGQVNQFQDDALPSGFVTVRVDGISNLTNSLQNILQEIAGNSDSKLESFDASSRSGVSQDSYRNFLKQVASGLGAISKEIANKNQLSQDDVAVFDMRREKNLDYVVNETPFREVLGKF